MAATRISGSGLDRSASSDVVASFTNACPPQMASTLDQEKTISLIAQLVVPRLAAWCAVLLADEAGELQPEPVYVWHADESLIDPLAGLLAAVGPPEADEAGRNWSLAMTGGHAFSHLS